MKILYINDKRVVLGEDTYFPFQQKVASLDDFSIIGIPSSKTIQIPVCVDNDDIFGNIASISRYTASDSDNLIGISFNQTKRVGYKLYDNSVIISEGIILIQNITEEYYEIQLFDKVTDMIEEFAEVQMDELDLIINGEVFTGVTSADFIKGLNDINGELKVLVNKNDDTKYNSAIVSNGSSIIKQTLPVEMTDIQFRTLKNYNFEYTIPLQSVVNSINASYDNIIELDDNVKSIFNEVHTLLGKVGINQSIEEYTALGDNTFPPSACNSLTTTITNGENTMDFKTSTAYIGTKNGKYNLNIPFELVLTPTASTAIIGSRKDAISTFYYIGSPDGSYIGDLTIGTSFSVFNGSDEIIISKPSDIIIPVVLGVNTIVETISPTQIKRIIIAGTYSTTIEYYPQLFPLCNIIKLNFDFSKLFDATNSFLPFRANNIVTDFVLNKIISDIDVKYDSGDIARTGAIVSGQTLFKKIKIRDFLINICKWFNLGVKNNGGKLNIHRKYYNLTDTTLPITNITSLDVNNFDFSRLKLTQKTPNFDLIQNYSKNYNKTWSEKVINTGYAIRKTEKEISFNIGIPVLFTDYSPYAYGSFTAYNNSGYRRTNIGVTDGLSSLISLCYINRCNEPIWVSDDSLYETSMDGSGNEIDFVLNNEKMLYQGGIFTFPTIDTGSGSRLLSTHYTASPYQFDNSGNIVKSLEMNKSSVNYAGIPDQKYSESATHYNIYFKKYINDIYDVNSHILDAQVWIDGPIDVYKIYNYKNVNYVIQDIPEYDPTIPDVYDVKFLKVKDLNNYLRVVSNLQYTITQTAEFDVDLTTWIGSAIEEFSNDIQSSSTTPPSYTTIHSIVTGTNSGYWDGITYHYTQTNTFTDTIYNDLLNNYKTINNRLYFTTFGGGYLDLYDSQNTVTIGETAADAVLTDYIGVNQSITLQGGGSKITELLIETPTIYGITTEDMGTYYNWYCTFDFLASASQGLVPFNAQSEVKFWKFKLRVVHSGGASEQDYTWDQLYQVQQIGYPKKTIRFTVKIEGIPSLPVAELGDNFYEPYVFASTAIPDQPSWYISYDGTFIDPITAYGNNVTVLFTQSGGLNKTFTSLLGGDNTITQLDANLKRYRQVLSYSKI